jgi:drug/metabolite transporter (DMT)-like permease
MQVRTRKLALAEGITAGVIFGTAAIFIRFLPSINAFTIVFWRLVIACLALGTIVVLLKKRLGFKFIRQNVIKLAMLGGLLALHLILFVSAVKDTTILNATILVNTTPIFSMLISSFIFKLKPSKLSFAGLLISFAGASVIALAEAGNVKQNATPTIRGDMEAVLAALVESLYLNYGRKIRAQMNIISIMLPVYLLGSLTIGILSIPAATEPLMFPTDPRMILILIGLGLLPTAVAHTLYFSSLSNLKSFETATMALIEPVGATILGILVFQEIPKTSFVLGATLILTGVIFIVKNET